MVKLLIFPIAIVLLATQALGATTDDDLGMSKRQLLPMPRIGKRQVAMMPSPRIGRSDKELTSNGEAMGSYGTENLVEPMDVQLRAAFIPRLGKRSSIPSESGSFEAAQGNKERQLVYVPGLGYRYFYPIEGDSLDLNSDIDDELFVDSVKRAIASYTPRIGRAVFAPRIGKKAAFVPRIG